MHVLYCFMLIESLKVIQHENYTVHQRQLSAERITLYAQN